ncbi:MAG TPA: carboxypeptidase regulatory-like domain-containing protein [Usitatibacter sp.]|nr:carboxypeptidase regulatory-like domain-containing protein [Usitatibacter sp.]
MTLLSIARLVLCAALAAGTGAVNAQNTSSAVGGRVTGLDGRPVSGASVTVLHVDSGSVNTAVTDSEGRYIARGLRVGGPYTITIAKDGITEKREGVFLQLADTASVDVSMGKPRETIVVTGSALASDKFSPNAMGSSTSIGRVELESLPSIQRNLQDYARLDPRVSQTDKERGEISVAGQNSRYNKVTIDGVNISDTFGLEANTLPTIKQPISIDAIESVQVNVSNYDVSQTGYTGGNINAVTKSGTNEVKGSVVYVYRDDNLAGDRYNRGNNTYTAPPVFKEDTKGFVLGGPIIKDKLFFFIGYEDFSSTRNAPDFGPIGSSSGGIVAITPAAINAITSLARTQYSMDLGSVGASGKDLSVKDALAKIDWNINANHRANIRYTKTEQTEPIFQNFSATQIATSSNLWDQKKKIETLVGQWFADWTPTLSTELKLSKRDYHSEPMNATNLPQVQFNFTGAVPADAPAGVNTGTRSLYGGTERSRHFNILDTKTSDLYFGANWLKGDHELKALVDYTDNQIYNAFLQDTKGNYVFSCVNSSATYTYTLGAINCGTASADQVAAAILENFQRGRPSSYLVQAPLNPNGSLFDGVAQFHVKNQGFALQDTWTVSKNLTIQYGVRVDTPLMPDRPLRNDAAAAAPVVGTVAGTTVTRASGGFGLDNTTTIDGDTLIQPRFGFNYTFDYVRPTQLRGGVGLFQGAAATVWISNIYSNTGVATRVVGCGTSGFAACPSAGGIFRADPNGQNANFAGAAPAANVDFLQDNLGQPSVWKANLAFEHKLPWWDMVVGVEYLATQTNTGIYYQHLNLGAPTRTGTDGRPLFYTPTAYNPACWSSTGTRITTGTVCSVDNRTRALSNPNFNNVLLASKTDEGKGQLATVSLAGVALRDFRWTMAYTYTEQTEANGLTSSVSNSNWQARASFNPNGNEVSNSAYLVRNRINASLAYQRAWFKGFRTSIGLFYEGRTGKPYSWTFSNDANGDGIFGNDLLYIPRAPGSGDVIFLGDTAASHPTEDRFWQIVGDNSSLNKYSGRVVERNSAFSPWSNSVDLRLSQDVPSFFRGHKASFTFDILNLGNLLNRKWGHIDEMAFQGQGGQIRTFVNFVGIDPASGKYIYSVRNPDDYTTRQVRGESQWAMQLTFRYEF